MKFFHKKTSLPQLTCTFKQQQQPQQNDLVFIICLKQSFNNYVIIWLTQASISETEAGRHEFEAILAYIVSSMPTRAPQWDSV